MKAEITYDLVMDDNMSFVEGCYRLHGGEWQVFIFIRSRGLRSIEVKKGLAWKSGATGINIIVPDNTVLSKSSVVQALSEALGVTEWVEVRGPDSIQMR